MRRTEPDPNIWDERFYEETSPVSDKKKIKLIHEGRYAAKVDVALIDDDAGWAPYLSVADARKLDAVRAALRAGRLAEASALGRVFELQPVGQRESA